MSKVRKKTEDKDILLATIESMADGILVVGSSGKIIFANKNLAKMWNIPQQLLCQNATKEALSFATSQLVDPKSFLDEIKRLKKFPQEKSFDIVKLKDGRVFERHSYPQKIGQDEKVGRVWSFRDVTIYKKAEDELKKQRSFFTSIVENIPDMIFVKEAKGLKFELFNTAGEKLLGQKRKDLIGKSDYDFFPIKEADFFIKKDREVLKSGKLLDIPEEPINTKGGQRFLHTKKIPLYDEKGKPEFLLGISEDITERKKLEENLRFYTEGKLKESEERFRKIFDNTNDAIVIHNLKGQVLEVNDSACKLLKYTRSEWLKLDASKVDSSEEAKKFLERVRKVLKDGSLLFETVHLTKDKKTIPVEVSAKLINFLGQKAILSVIRNITERKESEEKFRLLFESANDAIWILGEKVFVDCNSKTLELFKCTDKSEVVNHTPIDFSPTKQPDGEASRIKASGYLKKAFGGEPQRFYWQHKKKDGTLFDMEIALNRINLKGKFYLQAIGRDITKEKELEQAKSDFLSLASHQLRTPLSATKWVLEALISEQNLTPKQKQRFDDLVSSNERLIALVNDLLDVTRIESGKLTVNKKFVNIKDLVGSLLGSLRGLTSSKGKIISVNIPQAIRPVYCDPVLLHEALENLLSNAINYSIKDSRKVEIKVIDRTNDYLFSVHNEGTIDPSIAGSNIFERFVRGTKAPESQPSGSGLGLYLAKRVVEANGGTIWLESEIKSGTTFYFTVTKEKLKK